tara:strand:+ start:308 stop:946 length:639 start_codon:yes stop_codon:yes gene_type:complete
MMDQFSFGKYRTQLLSDVLNKDKQYVVWLITQPWYKTKYPKLYQESISLINSNKPVIDHNKFIVYTDGACPNNGNANAKSSIGIHFSERNPIHLEDISEVLQLDHHSNNLAELMAIYRSLEIMYQKKITLPIELYTDSKYCRSILLEWYEKWIKNDLLHNKKNLSLIKKTYDIYKKFNNIKIIHVRGHSEKSGDQHSYGNYLADKLARNAFQ